jgi:hypothetical protein
MRIVIAWIAAFLTDCEREWRAVGVRSSARWLASLVTALSGPPVHPGCFR